MRQFPSKSALWALCDGIYEATLALGDVPHSPVALRRCAGASRRRGGSHGGLEAGNPVLELRLVEVVGMHGDLGPDGPVMLQGGLASQGGPGNRRGGVRGGGRGVASGRPCSIRFGDTDTLRVGGGGGTWVNIGELGPGVRSISGAARYGHD